ncbi:MAG: acyl carrier protein [Oligoflexales bacterium]|nr:acyl carrier protein [Oligoflexales bacterium]
MHTNREELVNQIKCLIIKTANLNNVNITDIKEDASLFGEGLGLDSVDLLELVINLDKNFGLKIKNDEAGRKILASVGSIASAVENQCIN